MAAFHKNKTTKLVNKQTKKQKNNPFFQIAYSKKHFTIRSSYGQYCGLIMTTLVKHQGALLNPSSSAYTAWESSSVFINMYPGMAEQPWKPRHDTIIPNVGCVKCTLVPNL